MPTLRLTQHEEKENHYSVEIALEGVGPRKTATVEFDFKLSDQNTYNFRWYLEDYLMYPMDPNPEIARGIESSMTEVGKEIFGKVFATPDAVKIWNKIGEKLSDLRIEVVTDVKGATSIPWELVCSTDSNKLLALTACEFVRSHPEAMESPEIPPSVEAIRILLVICRPREERDVPFRSVAGHILKAAKESGGKTFHLKVLRPPTFKNLGDVLMDSKKAGQPYHIVHFDGHGAYLDVSSLFEKRENDEQAMLRFLSEWLNISTTRFSPEIIYPRELRKGDRGYLIFENPESEYNLRLVDGPEMGALLKQAGVPVLVLNACRSAHAEPLDKPQEEQQDIHSQVRSFGSFAQEVSDNGVAGVVAMRYNVYVVTAAKFMADLYNMLAAGVPLGEAVSRGRQNLAKDPSRSIAYDPINLQDWSVPVVYESEPIQLLPRLVVAHGSAPAPLKIDLSQTSQAADDLPRPEIGFYGRDETLLALDRAFDSQQVVLLHAYAGSGKTMTAAEFARWYRDTGGLDGPVLFTSFEQYKPLARVLDTIEQTFRPLLEQNNLQWLAMSDDERLNITLQIFKQIPVLWIWDNVEPVNGFPSGAASAWSEKEQADLKHFLQNMSALTRAKFLLTSRRDEQKWLGDLPRRVTLPPMPMQEMVQLARALAERQGCKLSDVDDWRPLLNFTQGNPMTLTVLAGQALRDGLKTKAQIYAYVNKLRNGEAAFSDEASEGRTKSLGASLAYGFEQAFSDEERKVLALLHFFQGTIFVQVLRAMGSGDWGLSELKGFTDEQGTALLNKAAEIGLLTAHGGGYYTIHPALPWFFKSLFDQYYPDEASPADAGALPSSSFISHPSSLALRAFVESLGELGNYYHGQYEQGNSNVITVLRLEEPNLLYARTIARQHSWYRCVISTMQGLDQLYDYAGRRLEWKRLVDEIVPDFVAADDSPRPGCEEEWGFVTEYRMRLAREAQDWSLAERFQHARLDWECSHAATLLIRPPDMLSDLERTTLRTLTVTMENLGFIQFKMGKAECVNIYRDAITLCQRINDSNEEAIIAYNLGEAYTFLNSLRNLDEAERWFRRDLKLENPTNHKGQAQTLLAIGIVNFKRFEDAKEAGKPHEEILRHITTAADCCWQAQALLPPDAVNDLAAVHNQLGIIYSNANNPERALTHYNESIHYKEMAGDIYSAGGTRFNIASMFAQNECFSDALVYARAALRNFEPYGQGAADAIAETQGLIADIEQAMKGQRAENRE